MQLYFAIAVSVGATAAWLMVLRLPQSAPQQQAMGLYLAPVVAAWLVALLAPSSDNLFYKASVVLGLLLALIALAIHASNFLPSYVAHAHLVLTYALYALAFGSKTFGWPTPFAILPLVVAGLLFYWLYPKLKEMWSSVAFYTLLIFLATWQALEIALQQPSVWMGWIAFAGMLLATAATLLEAQAHYHKLRPTWAAASLPTFVLAQLAIAWSVWV